MRGDVRRVDGAYRFDLGPAWVRGRRTVLGREVSVVIDAEGPQRRDLDPDAAAALEADPDAGASFDALAQFYRRAFLRWKPGELALLGAGVSPVPGSVQLFKAEPLDVGGRRRQRSQVRGNQSLA